MIRLIVPSALPKDVDLRMFDTVEEAQRRYPKNTIYVYTAGKYRLVLVRLT